jgi:hypothetical protein
MSENARLPIRAAAQRLPHGQFEVPRAAQAGARIEVKPNGDR